MKANNLILCMILLVAIMTFCNNRSSQNDMEGCLPGSVSILPFGDGNKPPYPLFITTERNDTTFYKYDIEDNWGNMENVGYIMNKDYFIIH